MKIIIGKNGTSTRKQLYPNEFSLRGWGLLMVGYGGTQMCLTGKKQGKTVATGNMGTRQFRKGRGTSPFPPGRFLLFLKRILRLGI